MAALLFFYRIILLTGLSRSNQLHPCFVLASWLIGVSYSFGLPLWVRRLGPGRGPPQAPPLLRALSLGVRAGLGVRPATTWSSAPRRVILVGGLVVVMLG